MKKTVLCIFSLVLFLLVACTILCAEIEDTMMTHAIIKQESGNEFEVKLQPSSIFEDMMGTHLYEMTEGVGWNTGLRAVEVPEGYYNAEALSASSFGKWDYIMSASRQPREGERIMVWALQRDLTKEYNVIMDGRDIGTAVLPNATLKIYLTASVQVRAERRYKEYKEKGIACELEEIKKDIEQRDHNDMTREISPLRKAEDAVEVDTSDLSIEEVVQKIIDLWK